jgi:3-phenylpropionate/cinnamic acid dioxygenase small subunit
VVTVDAMTARSDIVDLLAAIALTCDWGTLDEYLALLNPDAVWEMPANDDLGLPATRRAGHAEIAAGVRERRGVGLQGPGSNTIHVVASSAIDITSDTEACARSAWMYYGRVDGQLTLKAAGRYDDRFVRGLDERWRLRHRTVSFI